jgi:hypothetical protein
VWACGVWGCAGQSDLDGGWAPRDKGCETAFADAEERFVDLLGVSGLGREKVEEEKTYISRIGFAHDDVEDTDVAAVL